jgi:hypothetical protein
MDAGYENKSIYLEKEFITRENIVNLFQKYNVPKKINFLSVDVDFNDFYLLKEILPVYKLIKYEKICSMPNSMTELDELLPIMCDMSLKKETGTVNLVNPGVIEHKEILDMYKEIVDPSFEYKLFSYEDQMKILACERSNNELDTNRLEKNYRQVKHIS